MHKNANLGVPRNLHLMMKTGRNKDPKHIICHHQRSAILLETQRKLEEEFTPSVTDLYFASFNVFPCLALESFFCGSQIVGASAALNSQQAF